MRDNVTSVRELVIPKETVKILQDILDSNVSKYQKKKLFHKIVDFWVCSACESKVPVVELLTNVGNAVRIERYCELCRNNVYSREKALQGIEDIASYYNCQKVESIPHSVNEP